MTSPRLLFTCDRSTISQLRRRHALSAGARADSARTRSTSSCEYREEPPPPATRKPSLFPVLTPKKGVVGAEKSGSLQAWKAGEYVDSTPSVGSWSRGEGRRPGGDLTQQRLHRSPSLKPRMSGYCLWLRTSARRQGGHPPPQPRKAWSLRLHAPAPARSVIGLLPSLARRCQVLRHVATVSNVFVRRFCAASGVDRPHICGRVPA